MKRRIKMSLKEKSEENLKAATWAEENEMYNVAVSRLYYSMFQNLKCTIEELKLINELKKRASHEETYKVFYTYVDRKIPRYNQKEKGINNMIMTEFNRIKGKRKKADYDNENVCVTFQNYEKVKEMYKKINEYFNEVLRKE